MTPTQLHDSELYQQDLAAGIREPQPQPRKAWAEWMEDMHHSDGMGYIAADCGHLWGPTLITEMVDECIDEDGAVRSGTPAWLAVHVRLLIERIEAAAKRRGVELK